MRKIIKKNRTKRNGMKSKEKIIISLMIMMIKKRKKISLLKDQPSL